MVESLLENLVRNFPENGQVQHRVTVACQGVPADGLPPSLTLLALLHGYYS